MRDIRTSIAIIVLCLISFGIMMIYSASGVHAMQELGDSLYFLKRHVLFLVIGLFCMTAVMIFDYRELQKWAKPLFLVALAMLVLVLVPSIGRASHGARRWFNLGFFNFQPSEFAKIAMLLYIADFLSRKQDRIRSFREGFLPPFLLMGVTCLLILKQPDLGSSFLIGVIVMLMMFVAGVQLRYLAFLTALTLPALAYLILKVPYRLKRIIAFIDPWRDSQGVGFQLTQSQIALGSGGLWGVGLGKSVQKLFYLPAAHTDFILSIIGEELGFIGTFTVVMLFICFIWQGTRIAKRTVDPFGYFLSIGIVAMIGIQAMVNIGVSIGALPTKGLPLPFVSYGGSALIFNMVAVGLLLNISRVQDLD